MDFPLLFGDRSQALFDLWSLQHFAAGIIIGSILISLSPQFKFKKNLPIFVLFVVCFAYSWEAFELTMEGGWMGMTIAQWKGSFEHWANRIIGDPLVAVLGSFLPLKYKKAWKKMLIPMAAWLLANMLAPNSMYIQRLFLK